MVWEPKTCCCGASLKTGTLVLGWLGVIFTTLDLISLLRFAAFSRDDILNMCHTFSQEEVNSPVCVAMADTFIGAIVGFAMFCLFVVAICASLLWGVAKNKPVMMLPYLICQVIGLVIFGIIIVAAFIIMAYFNLVLGAFIMIFLCGLLYFLDVYLFLIVRACYLEVKQHSQAMMNGGNIAYVEQRDMIPYKM